MKTIVKAYNYYRQGKTTPGDWHTVCDLNELSYNSRQPGGSVVRVLNGYQFVHAGDRQKRHTVYLSQYQPQDQSMQHLSTAFEAVCRDGDCGHRGLMARWTNGADGGTPRWEFRFESAEELGSSWVY